MDNKKITLIISMLGIISLPIFIGLACCYESIAFVLGIIVSLILIGVAEFSSTLQKLIMMDLKTTKAWLYMLEMVAIIFVFFMAQPCFLIAYLNGNILLLVYGILFTFMGSWAFVLGLVVIFLRWLYLKYVKKIV